MNRWKAPFGSLDLTVGEHGVSSVTLSNGVVASDVDDDFAEALESHVRGEAAALRLDLQGVRPLGQLTLAKLLEIPHGEVRSYAWVAREIGRPSAVRSVASAIADNPIPVLIPCHRVVRSDGQLGDFSLGGQELKRELLKFEGLQLDRLELYAKRGVRYLVSPDGNFHLPSCKRAVGVTTELKSLEEAHDAHYEPCRRCRP